MGVTHHQQIQISGTTQLSGPVLMTGANQTTLTRLAVTGTARVSGIFSASAAGKQSTLTKLNVTGTVLNAGLTRVSGNFSASAAAKTADIVHLRVSATGRVSGVFSASAAGQQSSMTKLNVAGTVALSGKTTLVTPIIASAANAASGRRYIATAGTTAFSITTSKVQSSSRIFVSPVSPSAAHSAKQGEACTVNTIASGASFSIRYTFGVTPTGATGTVNWLIVNVA